MEYSIYQIDAFANHLFGGNPAAVVPLEQWLPDQLMQSIAMENNLAETAFVVPKDFDYHIRWFTPLKEVDLCGHATLAAAHVFFEFLDYKHYEIRFDSRSGGLTVSKQGDWYTLDFPTDSLEEVSVTDEVKEALCLTPLELYKGRDDYLAIVSSQEAVESAAPNFDLLAQIERRGIIVSAAGKDCDFVSRAFYPRFGINEDPVTGSAHTTLTPYWAKRLGKLELTAKQLSSRGGFLKCRQLGGRTEISGQAVTYMKGKFKI
ncbi:MAG: PhzF family phenazine biosynthesis protein [Bacteroidota bacterium]